MTVVRQNVLLSISLQGTLLRSEGVFRFKGRKPRIAHLKGFCFSWRCALKYFWLWRFLDPRLCVCACVEFDFLWIPILAHPSPPVRRLITLFLGPVMNTHHLFDHLIWFAMVVSFCLHLSFCKLQGKALSDHLQIKCNQTWELRCLAKISNTLINPSPSVLRSAPHQAIIPSSNASMRNNGSSSWEGLQWNSVWKKDISWFQFGHFHFGFGSQGPNLWLKEGSNWYYIRKTRSWQPRPVRNKHHTCKSQSWIWVLAAKMKKIFSLELGTMFLTRKRTWTLRLKLAIIFSLKLALVWWMLRHKGPENTTKAGGAGPSPIECGPLWWVPQLPVPQS